MSTGITRREALQRAAHLVGGAAMAPSLLSILAACERADLAMPVDSAGPYTMRTLSAEQSRLVDAISEAIIPETDTPGARAARVKEFVDAMLTDYYPADARARFLAGLGRIDAGSRRAFGAGFADCTPERQAAVLREYDRVAYAEPADTATAPAVAAERDPVTQQAPNEASTGRGFDGAGLAASGAVTVDGKVDPEDVGREAFFRTMKDLTLIGYYTSHIGATQELHVNPMGRYLGDIPVSQVGRTWA